MILNSRKQVCEIHTGTTYEHFREACRRYDHYFRSDEEQLYDLVVASAGGYPKDINFIQSHKTIHHAADFVRDGGRLVVLAHCRDGIGSRTFLPWFELGGWDQAFDGLAAHYMGNGGTALAMMAKLKRIRISLVTTLDPSLAHLIGFDIWSPENVQACLDQHGGTVAVIPNAGMVVKK